MRLRSSGERFERAHSCDRFFSIEFSSSYLSSYRINKALQRRGCSDFNTFTVILLLFELARMLDTVLRVTRVI